jgi:hypothetical protein
LPATVTVRQDTRDGLFDAQPRPRQSLQSCYVRVSLYTLLIITVQSSNVFCSLSLRAAFFSVCFHFQLVFLPPSLHSAAVHTVSCLLVSHLLAISKCLVHKVMPVFCLFVCLFQFFFHVQLFLRPHTYTHTYTSVLLGINAAVFRALPYSSFFSAAVANPRSDCTLPTVCLFRNSCRFHCFCVYLFFAVVFRLCFFVCHRLFQGICRTRIKKCRGLS